MAGDNPDARHNYVNSSDYDIPISNLERTGHIIVTRHRDIVTDYELTEIGREYLAAAELS